MRRGLVLVVVLAGCGRNAPYTSGVPPSAFSPSLLVDLGLETPQSARDPQFVLIGTDPSQARALLWSGEIGINVGPYGASTSIHGRPEPAFQDNHYDQNEKLQPVSSPLELRIMADGKPVAPIEAGYWQSLDMRYGVLTTHWFAPVSGGMLEARLTSVVQSHTLSNRWEFRGPISTKISIATANAGPPAWPLVFHEIIPGNARHAEQLGGASNGQIMVNGSKESARTEHKQDDATLAPSGATWISEWTKPPLVGGMPEPHPGAFRSILARQALVLTGKDAAEISIDGPLVDQQAINSFLYYLRAGRSGAYDDYESRAAARFSPFGLSSARYNGHVFWDADVWLLPALAFIEPGILGDYTTYRLSTLRDAPKSPFPWEDCLTGKETAPGDSVKEIHVSGSVLWGLEFAKDLGVTVEWDVNKRGARYYVQRATSHSNQNKPIDVVKRVADYYLARATKRSDGKLGLLDVMSPDENHIGANDLYTNLVAQWAINGATWRPASKPAATMYLPSDGTSFLTYDNDAFRGYKQAAAVLAIYPLQYPPAEAEAKTMMERFQDKVIPNGPAMSDSIHATIWARLGEPAKAYTLWENSWREFVKGPLLLFSEKRSTPTTYFTTGAAGCLQTVIYGFFGFRVDEEPEPGAAWKLQLKNGRWLSIKPHLPAAWKSATFRHFHVLGRTYTLTVKREGSKTVTSVMQGV
ncbi:MAG: hypothetical protein ACYC96_09180 [Fimbriimonadaceae bacterium]